MNLQQRARAALGVPSDPQSLIRSFLKSAPDDTTLGVSALATESTDDEEGVAVAMSSLVAAAGNKPVQAVDLKDLDVDSSTLVSPIDSNDNSISASTPSLSLPDSFEVEHAGNLFDSKSIRLDTSRAVLTARATAAPAQLMRQLCGRCQDTERAAALEKASLSSTVANLKQQLSHTQTHADSTAAELSRVQKVAAISQENQRLEISALEDRCQRLNAMLESETAIRRQNEEKASKYQQAADELSKLQKEAAELRSTMQQQAEAVRVLRDSESECRRAAQDSSRVKDLLQLDKEHLQHELRAAQQQCEDRGRAFDECKSQKLAQDVKVAQLTDQILTLQLTARSGFDERMDKEIARLREESQREVEAMKATSKDILDRENRVLREARASMESELQQLRHRNDLLSQQLGQLQLEMSNLHHEKNSNISELRAEVKMKSFELTQLGVAFEERMTQLRQGELELDVLRQEVAAHKSALHRLESETRSSTQKLRGELETANIRLQAYEAVEEEIDAAIVRSARAATESSGHRGSGDLISAEDALLQQVRGIPSNPERRVRQAVFLAQRLLETERHRDVLQQQVKQLQKELCEALKQTEAAKESLSRAAQPTSYLVSKLREEENTKAAFVNKCKVLEAELQQRKKRELEAIQDAQNLRERLHSLLQQRGELETVRAMLQQLYEAEASDDDDEDGENSDDEQQQQHQQQRPQLSVNTPSVASTPPRIDFASEESKATTPPALNLQQQQPVSPASKRAASARVLGLSPEQLEHLTSPPRSISNQPLQHSQQTGSSDRISPVSYKREIL